MRHFFEVLQGRNGPLFAFGCFNMLAALTSLLLTRISGRTVRGHNAWFKPFKFALSIGIFSWTMACYTGELDRPDEVGLYNYVVICLLGYEVCYIALQAGRGQLSHYNTSTPLYTVLSLLMGIAAAVVTLWTAYIGLLFCASDLQDLPAYYLWSIRYGIFLFVVFAFQGASMGARQSHTVGGPETGPAFPVLHWSKRYGDLRIAHFMGMHALQVLPLLSWYVLKNTTATIVAGTLYFSLAIFCLIQALRGQPLVRSSIAA